MQPTGIHPVATTINGGKIEIAQLSAFGDTMVICSMPKLLGPSTLIWLACGTACSTVGGQTVHTFKSTSGTDVKAVFNSYDPVTGNVEIMLPKSVPFSALTPETQSLVLKLTGTDTPVLPTEEPPSGDMGSRKCPVWGHTHISDFPENFEGLVLYTQGSMVHGFKDFSIFNSPTSEINDGTTFKLSATDGIESIPTGEPVTLEEKAVHPRSGMWVFRVRWGSKLLWVLADSLGKERDSYQRQINNLVRGKKLQHPVLTDGRSNDIKFAYSIYNQPILGSV